jgi:hypothetical protein
MRENKSRGAVQRSLASNMDQDLSMERSFAARTLRTSESRVTMRRRLASMRVGTQRRRSQRIARRCAATLGLLQSFVELSRIEDRRLLDLGRQISEPSLVMTIAKGTEQSKTVEVNP